MDNNSAAEDEPDRRLPGSWEQPSAGVDDASGRDLAVGGLHEARSFGAPAPSASRGQVVLRETRGPHEVWGHACGRDLAVTQLSPGPCPGHLLRTNLGDMGFEAGDFDGDLRVRGALACKAFSIVSILEQDGVLNQGGHGVAEGDILAIPPGGELDGRFRGRTAYAVVTAPWELVMQRAEAFEWPADPRFWTEAAISSPPPQARAACRRMLRGCAASLRAMGDGVPARAIDLLRRELLDGLLSALAQAKEPPARRHGVLGAARIVRGAEDFVEGGGVRQTVQIDDVCQGLGISRRTLYRAFHDLLDVSPKAYLRLKNMSAARARLLDAVHRPTTVTQVALDHGFWELGRFAGAYRAMFGESPSETLRAQGGLGR
jgi:AraC family ethanolamine operon transcriptional activator